jgi:glc operon protein GlcG
MALTLAEANQFV